MATTAIVPPEAREQSPEERQERVDLAHELNERIVKSLQEGRRALWELCHALYEFDQTEGWSALGYENQTDWLAQPEIGIARRDYFRATKRWRVMVVDKKLDVETLALLDHSKLDIVLPAIEAGKVRSKTAINDVESLSASDLREKYIKKSVTKPDDDEDVIDGEAHDVEDTEGKQLMEMLTQSATALESWIELGGDRRKAQRHWERLTTEDPKFRAIAVVGACVAGGDGAPDREDSEVVTAWVTIKGIFDLKTEA